MIDQNSSTRANQSLIVRSIKFHFFGAESLCDEKLPTVQVDARDRMGNTPLHLALEHSRKKILESLLRRGANPNLFNNEGYTPLHVICFKKYDYNLAELFFKIVDDIQQRVQIDAVDYANKTPLHWALESGNKNLPRGYYLPNDELHRPTLPVPVHLARVILPQFLRKKEEEEKKEKNISNFPVYNVEKKKR
uniref:Uncharacterized protein n=1 Tax=Trichogramma kaykai TaxID=54128 RepID=A0ABD2W1I5_9HYME